MVGWIKRQFTVITRGRAGGKQRWEDGWMCETSLCVR